MLEIVIPEVEHWDDDKEIFYKTLGTRGKKIQLEHSLVSLRKWEAKWHKPFLKDDEKSLEEIIDYIRCMTITKGVPDDAYDYIPVELIKKITNYMQDPSTATWFSEPIGGKAKAGKRETITAEVIYYWMIALNIPTEYEKWHLNQLLTLIKVVNIKNDPKGTKIDKKEAARQRAALNAARRAKHRTKG